MGQKQALRRGEKLLSINIPPPSPKYAAGEILWYDDGLGPIPEDKNLTSHYVIVLQDNGDQARCAVVTSTPRFLPCSPIKAAFELNPYDLVAERKRRGSAWSSIKIMGGYLNQLNNRMMSWGVHQWTRMCYVAVKRPTNIPSRLLVRLKGPRSKLDDLSFRKLVQELPR